MKPQMTKTQTATARRRGIPVRTQVRGGFSVDECKQKCHSYHNSSRPPEDLFDCENQCEKGIYPTG